MFARIREGLDADPKPGPWIAAARTLSERLIISDDTLYYLVEMFTECLVYAGSQSDPELVRISDEIEAIERAHGLNGDEYWRLDEGPPEWQRLNENWDHRADEIVGACLRELGHADIADLREKNRSEFEGRSAKGRTDLWGEVDEDDENAERFSS
jgi:hypothetical protein